MVRQFYVAKKQFVQRTFTVNSLLNGHHRSLCDRRPKGEGGGVKRASEEKKRACEAREDSHALFSPRLLLSPPLPPIRTPATQVTSRPAPSVCFRKVSSQLPVLDNAMTKKRHAGTNKSCPSYRDVHLTVVSVNRELSVCNQYKYQFPLSS